MRNHRRVAVSSSPGGETRYGDNLLGVADAPVKIAVADKLVYSPHTYGPSQHDRAEFSNAAFPANMPDVWENHCARAHRDL